MEIEDIIYQFNDGKSKLITKFFGEYVTLIADFHECLRLHLHDYPYNVDKYINDVFANYF